MKQSSQEEAWAEFKARYPEIRAEALAGKVASPTALLNELDSRFYLLRAELWGERENEPAKTILHEMYAIVSDVDQTMFLLQSMLPPDAMPEMDEEVAYERKMMRLEAAFDDDD